MLIPIDEARIFNNQEKAPKKVHDLKELIQSERLILLHESGIDPDANKLWKRMKEVQHQDNVIDEVFNGLISWTSENSSERSPVSLKYFRKLVSQVKKNYPIS